MICRKPFLTGKTRTIGQKWLVNEFVLYSWIFKKYEKMQSIWIMFSKVIVLTDDEEIDIQTDNVVKTIFSKSGGLKTSRFDENLKSYFPYKTKLFHMLRIFNNIFIRYLKIINQILKSYEKNLHPTVRYFYWISNIISQQKFYKLCTFSQ